MKQAIVPAFSLYFLIQIKLQKLLSTTSSFTQSKVAITTTKHKRQSGVYTYNIMITGIHGLSIDLAHCFWYFICLGCEP